MMKYGRALRILVVIIIIAAVGSLAYLHFGRNGTAHAAVQQTATVQRGTLVATVTAGGNIVANQQVGLNFAEPGTVSKVDVQVGDQVKAGQVLAELDTAALQLQVQNAEVNLQIAQEKLAQAQAPATTESIDTAKAQVASAQAAVASAQAAYDAAVKDAVASNNNITAAAAALANAQAQLQQAQAAYDKVSWRSDIGMLPQSLALQQATNAYNEAKANYDALMATTSSDNQAKVQQAQSALAQAQSQLTQTQNNLQTLQAGPDPNAVAIAQSTVDQARIALQQAQLSLSQAQIVAPFAGTVTAVNIALGQDGPTSGAGAIQITDLTHPQIVVQMDEVDFLQVKPGQAVNVSLDALPNQTLRGHVAQIDPAGVQVQGVVNYPVTIALDNPPAGIAVGMTASADIVVAQDSNVLMVPNAAVHFQGQRAFVNVIGANGQDVQTPVTTGLSNNTMTEIKSGLTEGETISLSSTTTTQSPIRGGGGFGGFPVRVGGR